MNNKKGFTLVELVAVIALLAVILLLVVPNIVRTFDKGKAGAFATLVQDIYKQAEKDFVEDYALDGYRNMAFCDYDTSDYLYDEYGISCDRRLNFNDDTAYYYVELNREGKVSEIAVSNNDNLCFSSNDPTVDISHYDIGEGYIDYDSAHNKIFCNDETSH